MQVHYSFKIYKEINLQNSPTQTSDVAQFLLEWEDEASEMCYQVTDATWTYITNITEINKNKMVCISHVK